jgi:putative transposase
MRDMKTVMTAKLKLHTTPEQFNALRQTQLAYRDSLNYVSQYAFSHGKMSNAVGLQDGTYAELRARFHLPSQMACSVPRQVCKRKALALRRAVWCRSVDERDG